MKSYRVRMTEGVEIIVRWNPDQGVDMSDVVDRALEWNRLFHVQEPEDDGFISINPHHVLYVREVAE